MNGASVYKLNLKFHTNDEVVLDNFVTKINTFTSKNLHKSVIFVKLAKSLYI